MNSLNKDNDFYRDLIVNHYHNPMNKGLLKTKNSVVFHHYSNSCVDDFYIELTFDQDIIKSARFEGIGCAISSAAIDIFNCLIINQDIKTVIAINDNYQAMLNKKNYNQEIIGNLVAFKNVLKQPNRIKCALIISEAITEIFFIKQRKSRNVKG